MNTQTTNWQEEIAAPLDVRRQLDQFVRSLCENDENGLIGIYLHGSLAMGCYQPQRSDIDLLVLLDKPPDASRCRTWAEQVLAASAAPAPIEISFLHYSQYTPWRHPTPFSFHFSEEWRPRVEQALQDGSWQARDWQPMTDPDLAAHFTVTRRRGICLAGAPVETAIPDVPWADYLDSIGTDLRWASERANANPVYLALNACRVWAAAAAGLVLSKAEGVEWAQPKLPTELAAIVARAAASGEATASVSSVEPISASQAQHVAQWIGQRIQACAPAGSMSGEKGAEKDVPATA